jgi:hypothetical protein
MDFDQKYKPAREKHENSSYLLRVDPFLRIKGKKADLNSYDDSRIFNSSLKTTPTIPKPFENDVFKRTGSKFLIKKRVISTTNK